MKVTTDVTDYISASKQHIEETERKRIEARALQQITEQKARDKRRIATVATAAAFVVVIVGSAAVLLVQNADAATKSAEFEQRLANVVAQDCASSPQSAEVSDRDVAQGLLQDHIKELLSEDRTARHNARDAIAELLDGRNSAALNRGFFDLMTERARIQPQNRYRLLLGMAETFGAMRGPIAMQDPAKVIKLLRELQIAINDPTFKKSFDNAIAALSASSSR